MLVVLLSVPLIEAAPVAVVPPVIPVPVGNPQVYVVPDGIIPLVTSTGVIVKPVPLQLVAVRAFTNAFGFNVIVTENGAPVHIPVNGVTVYFALTIPEVLLVMLPLILMAFVALAPPVKPVPVGTDHVYFVPTGTMPSVDCVGVTVNPIPAQATEVISVILAVGFTVTVTVNVAPTPQKEAVGVTT